MTEKQRKLLLAQETDVDGALYRFGGNEKIYIVCLNAFLDDDSMQAFRTAMAAEAWDAACVSAHTLKGAAGNMGFVPLMKASARLVTLLRAGQFQEAVDGVPQLERCYDHISEAVRAFLDEEKAET